MSWRGKYVGWYRLLENEYGRLVPELTDIDVMESVTPEDVLIIPTSEEDKPRNQRKALPNMVLRLTEENIEVSIAYRDKESMDLLRNLFHEAHKVQRELLFKELGLLNPSYETVLYSHSRDNPKPRLIRKYVSGRLDQLLIERILDECDRLRKGGRQNDTAYVHPESPELLFVRQIAPLEQGEYMRALQRIQPIYKILCSVKTQRELISSRLKRPKHRRNMYREFIEALNEARGKDLISAEKRRKLNNQWRKDEEGRELLLEELKALLEG